MDPELHERFGVSLNQAMENAFFAKDIDTLLDIAVAAGQYGYPDLYANALGYVEALVEEEGEG